MIFYIHIFLLIIHILCILAPFYSLYMHKNSQNFNTKKYVLRKELIILEKGKLNFHAK